MRISVSACIKISTVAQHNQVQHNENTDPGFNEDQKDPEQSQRLTKSDGYFNTKTRRVHFSCAAASQTADIMEI